MSDKSYSVSFANDPLAPRQVSTSIVADGVTYDVVIVPRQRHYRRDGGLNEQIVSQGPRGEVCRVCGR